MKSLIFSASMVPALLDGRKTRTSRIIKPQPKWVCLRPEDKPEMIWQDGIYGAIWYVPLPGGEDGSDVEWTGEFVPAPLSVGDVFYAKEKYRFSEPFTGSLSQDMANKSIVYYADDNERYRDKSKWRSPLFMPEWASRYKGEIVSVKAQRIQEITEEEAKAEGVQAYIGGHGPVSDLELSIEPGYRHPNMYRHGLEFLWDSLHGAGAWEKNEWVWAYEFRKVEGGK